ncbi:MAG: glycosyltransferase [Cytophagales bacterium]|nr:MAG: glycosyltransferase [Cytophagales bacterium]
MKKICIISPVYNEEEGISLFNDTLWQTLNTLKDQYHFEVIYVLDKSRDNTLGSLKKICKNTPNTKAIALSKRFGHQMSLVAGLDQVDADAVIMMDSDLEHPPEVIKELLEKFEEGYHVVNTIREYHQKVSFFKRFTSRLFYRVMNYLSPVEIKESAADFRLISRKVLQVFQRDIREQNQFLRGLIPWVGFEQTFVKFVSNSRQQGYSKYNLKRLINFAILGVISFSKVPLKISIFTGFMLSIVSFLVGLYEIVAYFAGVKLQPGLPTILAVVSFVGGMQLIVLGIIGEYIGSIYDEVKKRPLYIIEEIIDAENPS